LSSSRIERYQKGKIRDSGVEFQIESAVFCRVPGNGLRQEKEVVDTKGSGKSKVDVSELQAKLAALETEIQLVRDLRTQVAKKLKKQVQLQGRQSRLATHLRAR